jgi:hypothetical protein
MSADRAKPIGAPLFATIISAAVAVRHSSVLLLSACSRLIRSRASASVKSLPPSGNGIACEKRADHGKGVSPL